MKIPNRFASTDATTGFAPEKISPPLAQYSAVMQRLCEKSGLALPEALPSFLVDAILSQIVSCTQIQSGQLVPISDSLIKRQQQAQNPGHAAMKTA
jgi:hypothetical protein